MFESPKRWQKAGFDVDGEGTESNIMVASHASVPGVLFKRYSDEVSSKKQLENYRRRVEGAEKLREFIAQRHLTHVVVPQKLLHELPSAFARKGTAYVLVVERLELLDASDSKKQFGRMSDETLRELCAVLAVFRGLDSGARNVPFTRGGQIAFIDTERWNDDRDEWLRRIRGYLSESQRRLADSLR
jgi:hypothetical protein